MKKLTKDEILNVLLKKYSIVTRPLITKAMRQFATQEVKAAIEKRDGEIEVWMEKEKYSMPSGGEEPWIINCSDLLQFLHSKQEDEKEPKKAGCWSCGKPIRYHENGLPAWHCECGAEDPFNN